jgi:hypothetical protein
MSAGVQRARGTVAMNAEVDKLDWELMGHGLTNSVWLNEMKKDAETKLIRGAIEVQGRKMRGWFATGSEIVDAYRAQEVRQPRCRA